MAISQQDYMHAYLGDDDSQWKPIAGCFAPGTPLYNEEGGEIFKGPRRLDLAKRLLTEAGYVANQSPSWRLRTFRLTRFGATSAWTFSSGWT